MESAVPRGCLKAHGDWVTSIACTNDMMLSASRDKSILVWNLNEDVDGPIAVPRRSLHGHNHFVEDITLSSDGQYALSASWDHTLRLWDINAGTSPTLFRGHTHDVLCVAFSPDNRQIVSGSRDKTIKLWNTLGECKFTIEGHTEWVTSVEFSPNPETPVMVSAGYDRIVKVWDKTNCSLKTDLIGHTAFINSVAISPDGSLCASGGKDGIVNLWDLSVGKHLYSLAAGSTVNSLVFSPSRYWLCAATDNGIKIWCLETKTVLCELQLQPEELEAATVGQTPKMPQCLSLVFSDDGTHIFAGYSDNQIRVWLLAPSSS
eukprot:gnl/Trimastix_PCT/100.p2 GENE.gnl/Trimastix_PCT/100~~gnl/Trimastix_PCT/100.p2  ORF type:complete len:318 (+),score=86.48 gnl/Trimastix_PCT/100:49-1002(+)